jgi:eukaryotic-like serine/threonine-protein kinase
MSEEMSPTSRWRRMETLFHRASELDSDARASYLDAECAGDEQLRREVEALLGVTAVTNVVERAVASEAREMTEDLQPGDAFGPFRIEAQLGRGGMGAVYQASRTDRDFSQRVALKLVQSHLRAEEWTRRFVRERQILARLEHPYIARLLDGGSIAGRPYIAMEFVEGITVERFVRENELPTRARVELFGKICEAVGYAHGQLVVHRDIKPQNILVSADGTPKLLDFGIAKPMDEEGVDLLTRASERILTPQYAAPEQVLGQAITTATDVYALGALLYVMLTGNEPFESTGLSGFALEKAICEQDPAAPSTVKKIDSDLDHIVARAMRKEPSQRYSSVAALEADLDRYLKGFPVEARRGSWQYRTSKFLRRRAGTVVAIGVVIGTLAGGVVSTRIQQQKAEKRLGEVRELANRFLFEFHDSIAALPGATKARQMVVARAVEYLDRLAVETGGDAALERDLAAGYEKIRDIQFGISFGHLNDVEGAMKSGRRAIALREKLYQLNPKDPKELEMLSRAVYTLGRLMVDSGGGLDEVAQLIERSRKLFAQLDQMNPDVKRSLRQASALADLEAMLAVAKGDGPNAVKAGRKSVELQERVVAHEPTTERKSALVNSLMGLGDSLLLADNKPLEAIVEYGRAYDLLERGVRQEMKGLEGKMMLGQLVARTGLAYAIAKRHKEALPFRREAVQIAEEVAAADPQNALTARDLAVAYINASQNEYKVGSKQEAIRLARRMVEMFAVALKQSPDSVQARMDYATSLEDLADYLVRTEARDEPEKLMKEAIAIREQEVKRDPQRGVLKSHLAHAWSQLGDFHARWGEKSVARKWYLQALQSYDELEKAGRTNGLDRSDRENTLNHLAQLDKK